MAILKVECQEEAVTESWEVAVAPERLVPWAEEREETECSE